MKNLYGASPAKSPQGNSQDSISSLGNALEEWKLSTLPPNKSMQSDNGWTMLIARDFSARQQMDLRLKYHELRFAIHPK